MRAKTINEIKNFTRGMDPKAAMGTGGIYFHDLIKDRLAEVDNKIEKIKDAANKKWQADLRKMLIGKTITGEMHMLPKIDVKNNTSTKSRYDIFTIKVADVLMNELTDQSIIVADVEKNIYSIRPNTNLTKFNIS